MSFAIPQARTQPRCLPGHALSRVLRLESWITSPAYDGLPVSPFQRLELCAVDPSSNPRCEQFSIQLRVTAGCPLFVVYCSGLCYRLLFDVVASSCLLLSRLAAFSGSNFANGSVESLATVFAISGAFAICQCCSWFCVLARLLLTVVLVLSLLLSLSR